VRFGLKESVISSLGDIFLKYPKIDKVIIYGSRAKGNYKEGSDIDLAIIGDIDTPTLYKIFFDIDELLLPYKVDLTIFNKIKNSALKEHIERVGKVFYKKNHSSIFST